MTALRLAVVATFVLACSACGDDNSGPAPAAPTATGNRAPVAVDQIPDQIVNADESTILDVARYFDDPDGDTLTYTATSSTSAVTVSVEASIVTITGQRRGLAEVTVYARDVHGESATLPIAVYVHVPGEPPYAGTAFITAGVLTPADPTALRSVTYVGRGERVFYDQRPQAAVTINAYLFDVHYRSVEIEYQVNPEFGSREAARAEVDAYAGALGRLPAALLSRAEVVVINAGSELFHAGSGGFVIYTDAGKDLIRDGFLEEVLVHEGAHVSLDGDHLTAPGWRAAQEADGGFISEYARDFPDREDVAESILPYFALHYVPDRLPASDRLAIQATMPNRLAYFDEQGFDMSPYRRTMAAPIRGLVPFQPQRRWRPFEASPGTWRNR